MTIRNPKQEGTDLWDCVPQTGPCPNNCSQCYYNRPGAFYADISKPLIPDPAEVGDGIVRVNCGHDSNLQKDLVIETAKKYKNYFFNTSIGNLKFPGPVVLTLNPKEEEPPPSYCWPVVKAPPNLMFVRLRVSASNLKYVRELVADVTMLDVPVVLTFMRYYDTDALNIVTSHISRGLRQVERHYELKCHIKNEYWCPTKEMMLQTMKILEVGKNRLLTTCSTPESSYCRDCRNCESYYWITKRRMEALDAQAK